MSKINKFNEFISSEESVLLKMIEEAESNPSSNLEEIFNSKSYKDVISVGEKVIPLLLKRNLIIWDRGLSEITKTGLDPLNYDTSERKEFWKNWAKKNGF